MKTNSDKIDGPLEAQRTIFYPLSASVTSTPTLSLPHMMVHPIADFCYYIN